MAYRPPVRVGVGSVLPRTGPSFARARLVLAQRAGYIPASTQIASGPGAMLQWRGASQNLSARARSAGYSNSMQWLRQGATTGQLPGASPMVQPGSPGGIDPRFLSMIQNVKSLGRA
jgi:hypothetical protein